MNDLQRAVEIRQAYSLGLTQVEIAQKFRISRSTVSSTVRGLRLPHAGGPIISSHRKWKWSDKQRVLQIREAYESGLTQMEVAKKFKMSQSVISLIVRGLLHKDLI